MCSYKDQLKQVYLDACSTKSEHESVSMLELCNQYSDVHDWCIGPISLYPNLIFKKSKQWPDPSDIGWECGFIFNPSIIEHDDKLYMFYRAAPRKESLSSRIGLAIYTKSDGWSDCGENPLVFSTEDDEVLSVEDPKVYKTESGQFVLFYNGASPMTDEIIKELKASGDDIPNIVCTIKAAVSDDLVHWSKIGPIVPTEISRYWAKAAVIPRNPHGDPVRINGEYLMFLSEGCGGKQVVGHSPDLINWNFVATPYIDVSEFGKLCEVACAVTNYKSNPELMLLDFFYQDYAGKTCAGQALYDTNDPYKQLAINRGGSLSWGGIIQYDGQWLYAQGWDAKHGEELMYFYSAPIID